MGHLKAPRYLRQHQGESLGVNCWVAGLKAVLGEGRLDAKRRHLGHCVPAALKNLEGAQ